MKSVYYNCPFVPEELIAACGCRPRRLVPASENGVLSQTEGMCTFTEAWLESLLNKDANGEIFAAVFATSCDQMRRAYDIFLSQANQPAFLLNVPSMETLACLEYYQQELMRLHDFLCVFSGIPFDPTLLKQFRSTTMSYCQTDHRIKIAIAGGPVSEPIRNELRNILSESEAAIALDTCEDTQTANWQANMKNPSSRNAVTNIAKAYFKLPAIWKRPNHAFHRDLSATLSECNIDGIILFRHIFCDLWHSAAYELKACQPKPVLEVDLDGKSALSESAVSRIQAFLEMLA